MYEKRADFCHPLFSLICYLTARQDNQAIHNNIRQVLSPRTMAVLGFPFHIDDILPSGNAESLQSLVASYRYLSVGFPISENTTSPLSLIEILDEK